MSQNFDELVKAFEFGSTYPAPTTAGQQTASSSGGAPTSNLQQLAMQALQGVLGRSFKPGDHQSFKAALAVSFEYTEVGGHPAYEWKPRAYPAVGATDIGGGVSGAQYSLVSFASALHEQTSSLIENLHSLHANVDDEELEAAKAIFSTTWDEFIDELGREGGPRASRANELTRSIFDSSASGAGHLEKLGTQLGMINSVTATRGRLSGQIAFKRDQVVTSEEEGHLTNFIALTDYYFAVAQAFQNYRDVFLGKDLGSGLLLIERSLAVVEDGVNEVYEAMDSVNVDQIERLVIPIGFAAPDDGLTVEDFLSWIASFASSEAPGLIREGGRRGVAAIIPTAEKLGGFVSEFINLINSPPAPPPPANRPARARVNARLTGTVLPKQFKHSRVLNPLDELERYLTTLVQQAKSIIQ